MTPVDATSTCSGAQPTNRAVSDAICRATFIPASPVQALAHPLFTTIARATPPDLPRWSIDTRTGAAWARLVVNTAAAEAGRSDTISARSSPWLDLMPALTPDARNPPGVVMPPAVISRICGVETLMRDEWRL